MKRRAGCMLLLLPALFPGLAQAQGAGATDDVYSMDLEQLTQLQVSTPTRTAETLENTAGTVMVFTRADIRERGYRNLGELMQSLPGVYVQGNSSADAFNTVSWRGLAGNNMFIIMQNGVRINTPAGEPLAVSDNFPLYNAQRVEIVYGPGSALYGTDALSGVINIITDTDEGGQGASLQGEKGDVGYDRASLEGHFTNGALRVSGGAQRMGANNTDLNTAYPQQFNFGNLDDAHGNVIIPADERNAYNGDTSSWQAYADALLGEHWQFGYNGSHFLQPSTASDLPSFDNYGDTLTTDINTFYGRYRFAPTEQISGEFMANYSDYELSADSAFDNRLTNYTSLFKYAESQRRQAELVVNDAWAPHQTLTGGLVMESIQALPKTADLTQPYISNESAQQQGLFYAGTNNTLPVQIFDVHYHDWAAFLQQQSEWSSTVHTVAAVRYDNYSNFGGTTNPKLALIVEPTATQKLSLSYGTAFLAPSPYYTYELFGSFSGTRNAQGQYVSSMMQIPNLALGPERVQTWELDHQWLPDSAWQLASTLYHNRLLGFITPTQTNPPVSDFVPGGFIDATNINTNSGTVNLTGLDIRLDHTHDFASGRLKNWVSYSYADGSQDTPSGDIPIPFTPKDGAKLGSTWAWGEGYSVSGSGYAAGPSPSEHLGKEAPGYAVANIYARRDHLLPHLNAYARVDDLFDTAWYNAGAGGSTTLAASPQSRRTYTVGLELEL